jgi:sec-independent protein translocase protein TatA
MPIHPLWIVAILVIVLIIFGPGRLPELGSAAGKAMREFRKATSELTNEVSSSVNAASATPPATNSTTESAAKSTESASSTKN